MSETAALKAPVKGQRDGMEGPYCEHARGSSHFGLKRVNLI